jgi:hypothetical protein
VGTFLKIRLALPLAGIAALVIMLGSSGSADGSGQTAATLIACLQHHEFRYFQQPSTCALFAREYYPSGKLKRYRDIEVRRVRWTNWGRRTAVGVGRFYGGLPATLFAFDRVPCHDGTWSYGMVNIRGRPAGVSGGFHLRLARCGARRFGPL